MSSNYISIVMRNKIEECLSHIQLLLNQNKSSPQISGANDISHQYTDKYLLAEYLVNTSVAGMINDMQLFGNFKEKLPIILKWCQQNQISYRFECQQNCTYVKEIEREIEDPTRVEIENNTTTASSLYNIKTTTKIIKTIKEYIYKFQATYKFIIFSGVGDNPLELITITSRQVDQEITIHTKVNPYPETDYYKFDVNVTWLFQVLLIYPIESQEETIIGINKVHYKPSFSIDRSRSDCWTPSQNCDIYEAKKFFSEFDIWIHKIVNHFKNNLFRVQMNYHNDHNNIKNKNTQINDINAENIFNLTFPLLIQNSSEIVTTTSIEEPSSDLIQYKDPNILENSPTILPCSIVNKLLDEKHRTVLIKFEEMDMLFPKSDVIISSIEAKLLVILIDIQQVASDVLNGIDYIEQMIRTQLVAAIGKDLKSDDFAKYMDFHNRKLFKSIYQPKPFSFAVRRSINHSPEGQIRIEALNSLEPINTISSCSIPSHGVDTSDLEETYIQFPLNASTNIKFGGERYIHGWLAHRFTGESPLSLNLIAQARQFSCYIVLIGRMNSAKVFQPKHGFIAQSKDEFTIPLELEEIPTAKEFKDAIESLSPEQQRFAKAYRSMQLESTLFAVCIIQIKPQLEKVLNLAVDSLTKEIKLTQDLIKLFINYQIPSDLLSYDESSDSFNQNIGDSNSRLISVKEHVKNIQSMLNEAKTEELNEKKLEVEYQNPFPNNGFGGFGTNACFEETPRFRGVVGAAPMMRIGSPQKKGSSNPPPIEFASFGGSSVASKPCNNPITNPGVFNIGFSFDNFNSNTVPNKLDKSSIAVNNLPSPPISVSGFEDKKQKVVTSGNINTDYHNTQTDIINDQIIDYTKFPTKLDSTYEQLDPESKFRATIINVGKTWEKTSNVSLLSSSTTTKLEESQQDREKHAAFDLLDALTRSGALPIDYATLHIIVAGYHCFDQNLMDVVVCKNINPIERVERSTLIMATTLHDLPLQQLINYDQIERVSTYSPMLLIKE